MKNILFIAPPAGGKGTQSDLLVDNFGYIHISTGDLLRELDENSELGKKVNGYMKSGALVPDDIVLELLKQKLLTLNENDAFILDGYPRNIDQAEALSSLLNEINKSLDLVIKLNVPYDVLEKRALGRVSCPKCKSTYNIYFKKPLVEDICDKCGEKLIHRTDDNSETFKTRYDTYEKSTEPLISYYQNKNILVEVDGMNNTHEAIMNVINDDND